MGCIKDLYLNFGSPASQGTVFWLGYNTPAEGIVGNAGADVNGAVTECDAFAWTDPCTDGNITSDIQGSVTPLTDFGYNNTALPTIAGGLPANFGNVVAAPGAFDTEGLDPGFYGFLHVVDGGNGCCDFECVELEILDSPTCMDDVQITYCIGSVPDPIELSEILTLTGMGTDATEVADDCGDGNGNNAAYPQAGGVFGGTGVIGTPNSSTGQITPITQPTTPGTDVFTYTVPAPTSQKHTVDGTCCVDLVVDINISYINAPDAGTATSIAVCN